MVFPAGRDWLVWAWEPHLWAQKTLRPDLWKSELTLEACLIASGLDSQPAVIFLQELSSLFSGAAFLSCTITVPASVPRHLRWAPQMITVVMLFWEHDIVRSPQTLE